MEQHASMAAMDIKRKMAEFALFIFFLLLAFTNRK
jgi:hypothetical protein